MENRERALRINGHLVAIVYLEDNVDGATGIDHILNELELLFLHVIVPSEDAKEAAESDAAHMRCNISLLSGTAVLQKLRRRERERRLSLALLRRLEFEMAMAFGTAADSEVDCESKSEKPSVAERLAVGLKFADVLLQLLDFASNSQLLVTSEILSIESTQTPFFVSHADMTVKAVDEAVFGRLVSHALVNRAVLRRTSTTQLLCTVRKSLTDSSFGTLGRRSTDSQDGVHAGKQHRDSLLDSLACIRQAQRKNQLSAVLHSSKAEYGDGDTRSWILRDEFAVVHHGASRYRHSLVFEEELRRRSSKQSEGAKRKSVAERIEKFESQRASADFGEAVYVVSYSSPTYSRLAEPLRKAVLQVVGNNRRRSSSVLSPQSEETESSKRRTSVRLLLNDRNHTRKQLILLNTEFRYRVANERLRLRDTTLCGDSAELADVRFQAIMKQVAQSCRISNGGFLKHRDLCALAGALRSDVRLQTKVHQQLLRTHVALKTTELPVCATLRGQTLKIHPDILRNFLPLLTYKADDDENELAFRKHLVARLLNCDGEDAQVADWFRRDSLVCLGKLNLDRCARLKGLNASEVEHLFAKLDASRNDADCLLQLLSGLRLPSETRETREDFCETENDFISVFKDD